MTIHHFAGQQNDVFVPALLALLAAAVLLCLPVVLAQALQRSGRRGPVTAAAAVLGVIALGIAGWQVAAGFGALQGERAQVRADLASRYGVELTPGQVGELVDGGRPEAALPEQAASLGLSPTEKAYPLRLVPEDPGSDVYELRFDGKPLQPNG